ncbi:hypothetical protein KC332_g11418 [Hortaea werneckii]|uniref:C3H1-type domain-containing protein n=1 Tax=Hortaea werneckii TaxID=91943 RepID=A0A3M7IAH9_HORWE|nr:hypothetical protein KC342_g14882 [Hortaea werneckii]KAI6823746.1 hypothetical protein KC358_g8452 [Hortaea werneckii]KAI6850797.1 hypothetical protein KC350_g1943 [Hortaea werneckii]KAI6942349.1 hypothetical protein KC341_g2305 [Hortaea werneckii]KAI6943222.1 hypothetical protein KC348_g4319 [Hortaea werneckii]
MTKLNPYQTNPSFVDRSAIQLPAQAAQPRPLYFISRNNGVLVPLVPADELPYTIRLQGLLRVLRFDQTVGMQHVGTAPYTGMTFKIEEDGVHRSTSQPPTGLHSRSQSALVNPVKKYLAPDALARQALAQTANIQPAPITALETSRISAHEASSNWRSNASTTANPTTSNTTQSIIDAIVSTTSGAAEAARVGYVPRSTVAPPSGAQPDQDKKEYCTYWIRTGECDYMQQGCLYKHEMPDKATLEKIGLGRNLPRWWIEKQSGMRLGGREPQIVGPLMKSSEWLKRKPVDRDPSDASGESSESDNETQDSSGRSMASSQSSEVSAKSDAVVVNAGDSKATASKDGASREVEDVHHCKAPFDIRKASTTSDLIDFDLLLPTPSSSTPSITAEKSAHSSSGTTHDSQTSPSPTPITKDEDTTRLASQKRAATTTATKVFVFKGESADHHVAEARKRAARQYERRGAPVSTMGSVQPLEKQIQSMQKAKVDKVGRKRVEDAKLTKLVAKQVATGSSDETEEGKGGGETKLSAAEGSRRNAKTGNRIRRPAKVNPVKPANSPRTTILKKAEK